MKTRTHNCLDCRNVWTSEVELSEHATGLSGERKEQCPKCNSKNIASGPVSLLTKKQTKTFRRDVTENGEPVTIIAKVRYDDDCGNGRNSFAITGERYEKHHQRGEPTVKHENGKTLWLNSCGCIHDDIAKYFKDLAPLIKWHLCSSNGPMHYAANAVYHALQHGPNRAWVYFEDRANKIARTCMKYCDIAEATAIAAISPNYSIVIDEKTAKTANFEYARSSAIWPEATDEQLSLPEAELKALLEARLPALMVEFQASVESLGFVF